MEIRRRRNGKHHAEEARSAEDWDRLPIPVNKNPTEQQACYVVVDFKVVTKHTEDGVSMWVPGLPGCWSGGDIEEEALENIQDAISDYLAVVAELAARYSSWKLHSVLVMVA